MRLRRIINRVRNTKNNRLPYFLGTYQYEPLPSPTCVRLLELAPFQDQKTIRGSLKTFELREAPSFKALSYTWGDSHVKTASGSENVSKIKYDEVGTRSEASGGPQICNIICDGRLLKVTSNLRDALHMLADANRKSQIPKAPSYYWIDALCMDQNNIPERNDQVERMGDVFKKAEGVIVWLGKDDEFTSDALKTMRTIAGAPKSTWPLVPYTSFYDHETVPQTHRPNLSFYNWLGFIVLINRPWFKRAWVVQEIAYAKSPVIVCGKHIFPWAILSKTLFFIKATKWYHHLHTEKLRHVNTLKNHPGIYKRVLRSKLSVGVSPLYLNETREAFVALAEPKNETAKHPPSLRMLLDKHRFSKSSDPRDKVYAFLGLADRKMSPFRTHPSVLTPDYSLSVQEVYTEAARACLSSYQNLSLLSHVEDASVRRIKDMPSWVPDLSVPLEPYPLRYRYRGPGLWKAAGYLKWDVNDTRMAQGLLNVQGYRIDYIDGISILADEHLDPAAPWASMVSIALSLNLPYPAPIPTPHKLSRVQILWRTLTTNIYANTYPAPDKVGALFIEYILNLQIRHRLTPWSAKDVFQPHHTPLSDSIYPEWRTLLALEPKGSPYSLNAYTARLTAVVQSMFDGSYSPIELAQLQHELDQSGGKRRRVFKTGTGFMGTGPRSLRKGDEVWILHRAALPLVLRRMTNGRYRLIGEAYVHGVMHGEALGLGLAKQCICIE